jgi:hypothetical protein
MENGLFDALLFVVSFNLHAFENLLSSLFFSHRMYVHRHAHACVVENTVAVLYTSFCDNDTAEYGDKYFLMLAEVYST